MCIDSAAGPEDMKKAVNVWPCHGEYGNQVCPRRPSYFSLIFRFRFPVVGVGDHQINGKFW